MIKEDYLEKKQKNLANKIIEKQLIQIFKFKKKHK
jgi:hypothetical protein